MPKSPENYIPTQEDHKAAQEMMTDDEKTLSTERERLLKIRYEFLDYQLNRSENTRSVNDFQGYESIPKLLDENPSLKEAILKNPEVALFVALRGAHKDLKEKLGL